MDIIPVLDIVRGRVVQGSRGLRHTYRPVTGVLTADAVPAHVAAALRRVVGHPMLYVADLDAITRSGDNLDVIAALAAEPCLDIWLDAGVSTVPEAQRSMAIGVRRIVVGTETMPSRASLEELSRSLPPERLLVSLDVAEGRVISRCPALGGRAPLDVLDRIEAHRLHGLIALTLDRVGTGDGPDLPLLEAIQTAYPALPVIAGGGIRTARDLSELAGRGIAGALVATSLHRGWISAADIRAVQVTD